jgi:RNA recognition motif-containing protein
LPNQTLYINNLNEKIKIDELKQALFQVFSQYGDILEIHARKSFKMKGQVFIVFKDLNAATTAKHAMDGARIFGKDIVSL